MVNYQESKIYQICCRISGLIYVGATSSILSKRLSEHVARFEKNKNQPQYTSSKIIEKGDYYIELLEAYPCNSKMELSIKERFWIEKTECVNKQIPSRTKAEYRLQNRDKQIEYMKEYCLKHAEKAKQRAKTWYLENKTPFECKCGSMISRVNQAIHCKTLKHLTYCDESLPLE